MKTRGISIRNKLMLYISVMSVACCALLGVLVYKRVSNLLLSQSMESAMGIAEVAANEIDGAEFTSIDSEQSEAFDTIYKQLDKYKGCGDLEYIYTMKQSGDSTIFVVDTDDEDPAQYGDAYEMVEDMKPVLDGEVCCDAEPTQDDWGTYFSAYAPIFEDNTVVGFVGCDISIDTIRAQLKQLRFMILAIALICGIVCICISGVISASIGRNLRALYVKVQKLNSGDGDLTQQLDITSGDELEAIAGEFNRFIAQIRVLITDVANVSAAIENSSVRVNDLAKDSDHHLDDITQSLQSISARMEETSATTTLISDNITDTAGEMATLQSKADESKREADNTNEVAQKMQDEVNASADKTRAIIERMHGDLEVASKECEAVEQIDQITEQILKVANTTKILALNAHTEATRAGSFGSGFSIIADNISSLSAQISNLVKAIQSTNKQVKGSVGRLMESVTEMMGFLDTDVMHDYRQFAELGDVYRESMLSVVSVLEQFSVDTVEMTDKIRTIEENLAQMDIAINESTEEIVQVHSHSMDIKSETVQMVEIAEDNAQKTDEMADQIKGYTF